MHVTGEPDIRRRDAREGSRVSQVWVPIFNLCGMRLSSVRARARVLANRGEGFAPAGEVETWGFSHEDRCCTSAGQGRGFFDEARAHDRPVVLGRAGPGPHRRGCRRPVAGASIDRAAALSHSRGPPGTSSGPLSWGKTVSRADRAKGAPEAAPSAGRPPSIDRMASWPALAPLIARAGRPLVIEALRVWAEAKRGAEEVADEVACARWCEARLGRSDTALAAARLQPHRHGAAHQPRPRAARRGGDRGGGRGHALADDARVRPLGRRRAASATITLPPGCCGSPAPRPRPPSTTTPLPCCWC